MRKRDGNIRVCVDYRKLNKVTECDPEPMNPTLEYKTSGDKFFTKSKVTGRFPWWLRTSPKQRLLHLMVLYLRISKDAIRDGQFRSKAS